MSFLDNTILRDNVTRGVAIFTDQEIHSINLQRLDVSSIMQCPLGQTRGWDTASVPMYDRFRLGFTCGGMPVLDRLNEEWRRQILHRREVAALIDGRIRR